MRYIGSALLTGFLIAGAYFLPENRTLFLWLSGISTVNTVTVVLLKNDN